MSRSMRKEDFCPLCYGQSFGSVMEAVIAHKIIMGNDRRDVLHVVRDRRGQIINRKR